MKKYELQVHLYYKLPNKKLKKYNFNILKIVRLLKT